MEIIIPIADNVRKKHARREWEEAQRNRKPDADGEEHFMGLGSVGKMLWEVYCGEAYKRSKVFENPTMIRFMGNYYDFVEKRAKEMGYRYEDVQISADSGITADGTLLLRVEPKPGAEKTHAT